MLKPIIHEHKGDLPADVKMEDSIAVDTETMGLSYHRDALCVVQLSSGNGEAHVIQLERTYNCPNLKRILANESILKIFHFARFDIATIKQWLNVDTKPLWCTKIASKLARTYTDKHSLKYIVSELTGTELSKAAQSSDWGAETLTNEQVKYAADDVLYLHRAKDRLENILKRENRLDLAQACFDFLPVRAKLDLEGWEGKDIFAHT